MNKLDREKKIGLIIIVIWILGWSLFIGFQLIPASNAIGGGGGFAWQAGTSLQSTAVTVNSTTNARVISGAGLQEEVKGSFIVAHITTFSPHVITSSISDTAGDSYSLVIRSCKFECVSLWVANYTGTNFAANTITVTFNASTSSITVYKIASGVLNTNYQAISGNGTGSTVSVTSFTPNTNSFCTGMDAVDSGNTGSMSTTTPNFWDNNIVTNLGATIFHTGTVESVDNWLSGYGTTTISSTVAPVTGTAQWDMVAMCFQGGPATTTTSTTTTTPTTTTTTKTTTNTTTTSTSTTTSTTTATTTNSTRTTTTTTSTTTSTTATTTSTNTTFSTITGTIFPEPAGSLDLWVVTLGLAAQLIFLIVPVLKRSIWFLTFISGMIGLALAQQLATSPTIAYGSTFFTAPQYLYVVVALVAVMSFAFLVWEAINRR